MSTSRSDTAFLFDVDNTLLDNDRVIADLQRHLERDVGTECAQHYWRIFEQLRTELGYADYLGALQGYRGEYPHDPGILTVSRFLLNYPFADRLFPRALEVIEDVKQWGSGPSSPTVMWSSSHAKWIAPDCLKRWPAMS
jgi:FMN phosphatase YigB (HAD superfamily)